MSLKDLKPLGPYLRPNSRLLVASLLLSIPLSLLIMAPVGLVKYMVDELLIDKNPDLVLLIPAALIVVYVINFPIRFFHFYFIRLAISRVNRALKRDLFRNTIFLSADHFTVGSTGSLISRVGSDPNLIDGAIYSVTTVTRESLKFLFLLAAALYLNWKLTLFFFLIFPPLAWLFSAVGRNMKRYIQNIAEANAQVFSTLQETYSGIRVVQSFRLEQFLEKKFLSRVDDFQRNYLKTAKIEEVSHPSVELVTGLAIAGVVSFGGSQVLNNQMSPGDLLAFFTAFGLMLDPIRRLNDVNVKFNQAAGAAHRIFEVMGWKSKLKQAKNPEAVSTLASGIKFDQVKFAYPDEPQKTVLENLSFEIKKGEVVALVGESGAGKSSIAQLIPRIFDCTGGAILWDGLDIKKISLRSLRDSISVVSQDVFLFNDTVAENIRAGRLSATHDEIEQATKDAGAYGFIQKLPKKFDEIIGERGQKLSGGERQRISIARAFLRDAPLLILDEATSSLDSQTEKEVQNALEKLMLNRTTLIIAHRLSTIKHADKIIVLKDGKICEKGTHIQLLKKNGVYAHLQGIR